MNRILAYFSLLHFAKILDIWTYSDYNFLVQGYPLQKSGKLQKKIKNFTLDFSRLFRLKIGEFCNLLGSGMFFFQSIQLTNFIQKNVLIIIFRFCSKFCFHVWMAISESWIITNRIRITNVKSRILNLKFDRSIN